MENYLHILDETLNFNNQELEKGGRKFKDILILENPNKIESSLIPEWLNKHVEDIEPYYILANTQPKTWVIDDVEGYFDEKQVVNFNKKDVVLIIKHFGLTTERARKHLIDLVSNRRVIVNLDGSSTELTELKMIIATAYPDSHFGYSPLSELEMSKFAEVIKLY